MWYVCSFVTGDTIFATVILSVSTQTLAVNMSVLNQSGEEQVWILKSATNESIFVTNKCFSGFSKFLGGVSIMYGTIGSRRS